MYPSAMQPSGAALLRTLDLNPPRHQHSFNRCSLSRVHPPVLQRSTKSAFMNKMDDNVDHASEEAGGEYLFHQTQSHTDMFLKSIQSLRCQYRFAYALEECRHIDHNFHHVVWQFRSPQ